MSRQKQNAYEGASTAYRMSYRGVMQGDQDTVSARELRFLQARSHDLVRNSAPAKTAKHKLQYHWTGTGIRVRWKSNKMQKLWDAFAKNPNIDGHGQLANTCNMWGGALFESGEALSRMLIMKRDDIKIPLWLQTIESEQLDPMYFVPGKNIRSSMEFDGFGKPINYHFLKKHPGNFFSTIGASERVIVPSNEVLHGFQRERPGQWRGVPHLSAIMPMLYQLDDLTDATIQKQLISKAVTWIIKKTGSGPAPAIAGVSISDDPSDIDPATNERRRIQEATVGGVHYLNSNEDIELSQGEDIGANFTPLLQDEYRRIAGALDLTYEHLTGDLQGLNFSSIRAKLIEFRVSIEVIQILIFINMLMEPLANKFKGLAGLYVSAALEDEVPKFIFPKRYGADPLKDVQADLMEVQAGFAAYLDKLAERGVEFEDVQESKKKVISSGMQVTSIPETMPQGGSKEKSKSRTKPETVTKETVEKPNNDSKDSGE